MGQTRTQHVATSRQRDAGRYQRDVSTLSLVAESRRSARRLKSVRAARSRRELVSRSVFLKYTESRVTRDKTLHFHQDNGHTQTVRTVLRVIPLLTRFNFIELELF